MTGIKLHFEHHWPIFASEPKSVGGFVVRNSIQAFIVCNAIAKNHLRGVVRNVNELFEIKDASDSVVFYIEFSYPGGQVDVGIDIAVGILELIEFVESDSISIEELLISLYAVSEA